MQLKNVMQLIFTASNKWELYPEVSYDKLDVNRLTAKVCMKELSLTKPFIDF